MIKLSSQTTRINKNNIQEGYATSVSVPLACANFSDYLEPGIKPLVLALRAKGYFTLSSCEGHSLYDYSEVIIAVPDGINSITTHVSLIKIFGKKNIDVIEPCEYMECADEMREEYKDIPFERWMGNNYTRRKMTDDEAVKCLNTLFDRQYNNYILFRIKVIPTLSELILPLAWFARNVLGSLLIKRATHKVIKELEVFDG